MDTLEQLTATLDSLEDLRGIVRTMKALAAASIRQYERAVESLGRYHRTIELGLHVVLRETRAHGPDHDRRTRPRGVIVFGSDHGLCGRFNEDLADFLRERVPDRGTSPEVRALAVGGRMAPLVEDAGPVVDRTLAVPGAASRITSLVDQVLMTVDDWQARSGVAAVEMYYSRRRAGSRAEPTVERLLPVDLGRLRRLETRRWPSRALPTFTMDRARLFAALVRHYLSASIFRACAESQAAEHASRLSAMQAAARDLEDRHAELVAEFRRRRQEAITAELLDVVAGYEAIGTPR